MAIITATEGPFSCNYWHIQYHSTSKGDNVTTLSLGGYADQADRDARFPNTRESRTVSLTGFNLTLEEMYIAILALPEWGAATSDV